MTNNREENSQEIRRSGDQEIRSNSAASSQLIYLLNSWSPDLL